MPLVIAKGFAFLRRRRHSRIDGSAATLLAPAGATMCLMGHRIEFEPSSNGKDPKRVSVW